MKKKKTLLLQCTSLHLNVKQHSVECFCFPVKAYDFTLSSFKAVKMAQGKGLLDLCGSV